MKRVVAIVVLVSLLFNCTYTSPHYHETERNRLIVISERVGETIDAEERLRFGLFVRVEDFRSAKFYEITDYGYDVEIVTEHEKLVAYNRDPSAVMILRDFIEHYEVVKDSMPGFEKKWGIVDYDTLGQPITRHEINMNINPQRTWQRSLAFLGMSAGCLGSCLIIGMPKPAMDVPSDYDNSEDKKKILAGLGSAGLGGVLGWFGGGELDKRNALRRIKEQRKPRIVE